MVKQDLKKMLRQLPAVDEVLNRADVQQLIRKTSRTVVVKAVRMLLNQRRDALIAAAQTQGHSGSCVSDIEAGEVAETVALLQQRSLRRVINATGIIVHTNLGRAPLAPDALAAAVDSAAYYSNLEFDIISGERGTRTAPVEELLRELTGAPSAFVVNNNAAAVLLCLHCFARNKEVIVSRGELMEIGGSFRIPDILAQSSAQLCEVGTTNRTRISDYRQAITDQTAMLFKAHTSNYRIVGFTEEVALSALAGLGKQHGLPVMLDMGSGNFLSSDFLGLPDEPTVQAAVKSGIDLVSFSGDKLLGGPQAGIIVGRTELIERIKRNPLTRALRTDKMTLAALEATLKIYVNTPERIDEIPVIAMLRIPEAVLKKRARRLVRMVKNSASNIDIDMQPEVSQVGGGAFPLDPVPTWAVVLNPDPLTVDHCIARLREATPPIVARVSKDRVILDMRTVRPDELSLISEAIIALQGELK